MNFACCPLSLYVVHTQTPTHQNTVNKNKARLFFNKQTRWIPMRPLSSMFPRFAPSRHHPGDQRYSLFHSTTSAHRAKVQSLPMHWTQLRRGAIPRPKRKKNDSTKLSRKKLNATIHLESRQAPYSSPLESRTDQFSTSYGTGTEKGSVRSRLPKRPWPDPPLDCLVVVPQHYCWN